MENSKMTQNETAEQGRGTDNVMAHLSLGEVVIPRAFLDDPQVMQLLQQIFQAGGADMNQYTVGHEANSTNPETGYPEFGFGKFLKKAAGIVLPNLGFAGGFTNGLIQGDGLGGALKQGVGSGLQAAASIYGGPLAGAVAGGLNAKLNDGNPLYGAIGGGIGGALSGGSLDGLLGNIGNAIGVTGDNSLLGTAAGSVLGSGVGPTQGTGILGNVTRGISSVGDSLGGLVGGTGGGGSSFGINNIASALGGVQQDSALKKQRDQLLAAQNQQLGNLQNLNPINVQNDPGYQFNQQQGEEAINRSLGARGSLFSGQALKAASQFNQDLANNYYNQAYQRQAGLVGAQNDIYGNTGNINANATLGRSNNINQTLANALGANVGDYGGAANTNLTDAQLLELMKQRGLA